MNVLNRPAIKFEARNFISVYNRWVSIFLAGILPFLIGAGNNYVNLYVKRNTDGISDMLYLSPAMFNLFWIMPIVSLLLYPITVALSGYYTNCLRNNEFKSQYVYTSASNNYIKFLLTEIIRNIFVSLWSILLLVPGIIKGLSYSMTRYIICDNPTLSSTEAIEISKRITKGFKGDILLMYLSFIPWLILVTATFSIASIYVIPYMGITEAMFYENLKKHAIETGVATPNEFAIY